MKIGKFRIGKKEQAPQEEALEEAAMEEFLEDAEQVLEIPQDVETVRPHAPLQELSLDAETSDGGTLSLESPAAAEEEGEPIKLVEVQPAGVVTPPVSAVPPPSDSEPAKKNDPLDLNASIGNIFNNIEDEENPLANLIKSLPDVAATELIDDLKEINDIIKDWQKK